MLCCYQACWYKAVVWQMLGRCYGGVCRSREEAFKIGSEIAREVTASNPPPVTLKFEKVYHPCVLLTKKRYVGYMYESPSQVSLQQLGSSSGPQLLFCLQYATA